MIKISIIVPVYEGENFIIPFFSFFKANPLPNEIELIIVDNGSTDVFYNKLVTHGETIINCNIYRYSKKQSSYAARNYGFSKAKGNVIAFTDFDCLITENYINELINFPNSEFNLVSGKIELYHIKNNIYEVFDKYAYLKQEEYFDNNYAATANLVLNRNTFIKLKGFKELTSGGDNEFCKRSIINGFCIKYNENLLVKHPLRGSYIEHIKKTKRLGIGHGQLFKTKNIKGLNKILFLLKTLIGVFFPFHQLKIFYRIIKKEQVTVGNFFLFFRLCFNVGMIQRIQILKKSI